MLKFFNKSQKIYHKSYCSKATSKSNLYSHTVLLPKTKLPLRLEGPKLVERDKNVHRLGAFDEIYEWQKIHLNEPEFILHDGPPYANGKPHMGHAINKILKDTILRYKILDRQKVNYVPGWDCHGLPIELKALSDSKNLNPIQIRSKASSFADKTIQQQMDIFKSWGVIGDWTNSYKTKSVDYVENQLRQFLILYEKGYIYRDVKPIHWSPSSRTALAEAELEYNENHKSPSVYVRIKIKNIPQIPSLKEKKVYAIIWTTTPWTLPSNQAICYNNTLSYCLIKKPDLEDKNVYIVAMDLFEEFSKETNCEYQLLGVHSGDMLKDATYVHPIYKNEICSFLHSSHATSRKGTGLVHTAPAHGPDDFLVAMKHKIAIRDLITDEGLYKPETGEIFANKFVLTEGNEIIIKYLDEDILHKSEIIHSYPYDWRTKKPVIIKASKQWFIDTEKIKNRAVELLKNVNFMPEDKSEIHKKALVNQLQKRPYWCISRQRKWGVPIPVFYGKESGETYISQNSIDNLCTLLKKHGTDFWWKLSLEQLLPNKNPSDYKKGKDILDIWFDSGVSWSYVLKTNQIADLYLEGVDQTNGWFQSSLITSTALRDKAPYKTILVHGFAVDKNGAKMSKYLGNVVDPVEVTCGKRGGQKAYGIDTLRWWVACHANQVSLASVSDNILEQSKDEIQKIRSVLRFSISALSDYEYHETDFKNTRFSDRYILHELYQFYNKAKPYINSYNFHKINTSLIPLLTNQISAIYFSSIKDRLYCEAANSKTRKSAQYTLLQLYYTVANIIGGILPHLVEETYSYLPQKIGESFFTSIERLEPKLEWQNFEVAKAMDFILEVRKEVNKQCEVGSSLSSNVVVELVEDLKFQNIEQDLKDLFQVSNIELIKGEKFSVRISKSSKFNCPRCRLVQSNIENELCLRCQRVIEELNVNKIVVS